MRQCRATAFTFWQEKNREKNSRVKSRFKHHFLFTDSAVSRLVEKRKSGFAKDIHIQWGVIFPCMSSIFTKNHIQTPMELILHWPHGMHCVQHFRFRRWFFRQSPQFHAFCALPPASCSGSTKAPPGSAFQKRGGMYHCPVYRSEVRENFAENPFVFNQIILYQWNPPLRILRYTFQWWYPQDYGGCFRISFASAQWYFSSLLSMFLCLFYHFPL